MSLLTKYNIKNDRYPADFVESYANGYNRNQKNTSSVINVIINRPNDATEDLEKIERIENFVDQ